MDQLSEASQWTNVRTLVVGWEEGLVGVHRHFAALGRLFLPILVPFWSKKWGNAVSWRIRSDSRFFPRFADYAPVSSKWNGSSPSPLFGYFRGRTRAAATDPQLNPLSHRIPKVSGS